MTLPNFGKDTLIRYAYRRPLKKVDHKLVKPNNVTPVGVVMARLIDGKVCFGWSKCAAADQFSRATALKIAYKRCQVNRYENIAVTMRPVLMEVAARAEKYFKQPVELNAFEEKQLN